MGVRWRYIQNLADRLLVQNQITQPPIPVDTIAQGLKVRIVYQHFDEHKQTDISGFFLVTPSEPIIGVNNRHSSTRIRFTIAHELGHFLLHHHKSGLVHVDHSFKIKFRSDESSQGTNLEEIEANAFAAELLMPLKFLKSDLASLDTFDYEDDAWLRNLADRYKVSSLAMNFRLNRLGYING